ncbi:MAG: penicillin-binding protein 2 [Actinobacteria bacterium]|nr:MAG: penicillin-binding protein 2 [Actinomycetota bacterium]
MISRRFLPPDPRVEEPYRLTPRLALRVGLLGMVAIAVFATLFLRLWSLQILNGQQLLRAAQNNQRRDVRVEAPRGSIVDRNGLPLVTNVPGTAVQIWQTDLPKDRSARLRELRKLARVLLMSPIDIGRTLRRHRNDLLAPVTIKDSATELQVGYLKERRHDFPGVQVANEYLRYYPHRELAAHVLGYVGEISQQQLDALGKQGYHLGDTIGQSGIESVYDRYLRGTPGLDILRVDSLGSPLGQATPVVPPHPGSEVRLTIDVKLQAAAEQALRYGIERARNSNCYGCWNANGGSIVALDPRDGSVRALASYPTYRPSLYVGRVRQRALDAAGLTAKSAESMNYPALDRGIDAAYPPGSTWKPVTAIAAMQEHILQPFESLACTGSYTKAGHTFKNWDPFVNEAMTLTTAIAQSCDTYFYQVGYRFYGMPSRLGPRLQAWAHRFGFGQKTGIDLGPEQTGLLPTPDWRKQTYTKKTDPKQWQVDSLWKPGDSIQLAIGQKDLLVTPMQMARFYAMVANGGKLVTPHLLLDVEQPSANRTRGRTLPTPPPPAPEPTNVDAQALAVVREGLFEATHSSLGTSSAIFGGFPISISGKTGTAEKVIDPGDGYPRTFNQSWWCGYGPSDSPDLVVCALIENGGHGGDAAAPAALKVFEQFFGKQATQKGPIHSD